MANTKSIQTDLEMVEYTINRLENLITIIERDKSVINNHMGEYKRLRGVNQFIVNQNLFDDELNLLQRKIRTLITSLEKNKSLIEIYTSGYPYNSRVTFPITVPAIATSATVAPTNVVSTYKPGTSIMHDKSNNDRSDDNQSNTEDNSSSGESGNYTPSSPIYDYDYKPVIPVNGAESKPGNIYNGDSKPVAPEQEIPNNDNVEPTPYTPPVDNNSNSNNYYWPGGENSNQEVVPEVPKEEPVVEQVDEIVGGNKYTKIPTATISKVATTTTKSGNSVIPVLAGISAAAAAGIGAKAYMDRKKNSDNSDSDIDVSEWSEEYTDNDTDNTPVESYSATSKNNSFVENDDNSLSEDNSYEELEPAPEKYDARNNSDLSDMQ